MMRPSKPWSRPCSARSSTDDSSAIAKRWLRVACITNGETAAFGRMLLVFAPLASLLLAGREHAIEHSARQEHSATPVPANRSDHPIIGHRASLPKSHWPPMKALA